MLSVASCISEFQAFKWIVKTRTWQFEHKSSLTNRCWTWFAIHTELCMFHKDIRPISRCDLLNVSEPSLIRSENRGIINVFLSNKCTVEWLTLNHSGLIYFSPTSNPVLSLGSGNRDGKMRSFKNKNWENQEKLWHSGLVT